MHRSSVQDFGGKTAAESSALEQLAQSSKGQQLFAVRLDDALQKLLIADVNRSFDEGGWDVSGLSARFQPEIESLISVAYYLCSLGVGKATPGMEVMNLQLNQPQRRFGASTDSKWASAPMDTAAVAAAAAAANSNPGWWERLQSSTRTAPIAGIVLVYLFRRLELAGLIGGWSSAPSGSWRRRCYLCMSVLRTTFRIVGVANTLLFLWNGAFVSVFNRIFGFRLLSAIATGTSVVSPGGDSSQGQVLRESVRPGYTNTLQFLKSRQIAWLAVLQLLGSVTYVLASSDTHLLNRSVNTSANATAGVVDWGVLGVWAQRLRRQMTRATAQLTNTARSYFGAGPGVGAGAGTGTSAGSVALSSEFVGNTDSVNNSESPSEGAPLRAAVALPTAETAKVLKRGSSSSAAPAAASSLLGSTPNTFFASALVSSPVSVPVPVPRCVHCSNCPAENAQKSSCGHIYCYMCLISISRQNMHWVSASAASPGDRDGSPYLCPVCDAVTSR